MPSIKKMINSVIKLSGLDVHTFSTVVLRSWGIIAGAITLVMLPLWLSPAIQGYYYTFGSLLSLQIFFELGLSQVIIQLVAHEAAHLKFHDDGTVSGPSDNIKRLRDIIALLKRWYRIAAVLFVVLGGVAGVIFFERNSQVLQTTEWAPIWCAVVVLTAINLYFSPRLAILEGTGQVSVVARLRLWQSLAGYTLLWGMLIAGAQLWSTISIPFVSALVTFLWIKSRAPWLKISKMHASLISWRRDIFPLQWRIAVSWACGYFIFSLFTPIVFITHGATEAGRVGMAMSIFSAVTTLGLSWVNAKAPVFVMHLSRNEYVPLNRLFRGVLLRSTIITALLSYTIVGLALLGSYVGLSLVHRIITPSALFWIACASTVNTAVYAAATYMRAHREEPMLPVSIASAFATVIVLALLRSDIVWMMFGYAAVSFFITLPWTCKLMLQYSARHSKIRNCTT